MECYACDNQATRQCTRCSRVYCELHGGDLCAECLRPAGALPSFNLYRGSLLALIIGSGLALWLLVQPPGEGESESVVIAGTTPTTVLTPVESTSTPPPAASPTASPTSRPARPTRTPTPEPRIYIVQEGDTLLSIAEATVPDGSNPVNYANRIAQANGISQDAVLPLGEELILP
jgi:LysM domain